MNELALFAGAGGAVYASKLLGHRIVGYVESDDYCQRVIRQRVRDGIFDDAPIFPDVRTFDGRPYCGRVDLVSAGVPCQWISVAGKREDPSTERNLWPDTLRIVGEVRPLFAYFENPPILVTHRYFGTILKELAAMDYELAGPPQIIGCDAFGAWHERKRAWFLAADTHRVKLRHQFRGGLRTSREDSHEPGNDGEKGNASDADRERELQPEGSEREERGRVSDGAPEVTNALQPRFKGETGQEFSGKIATSGNWWAAEPDVVRVVHGLANRRHRIRALGNGQVPIVAATAFRILMDRTTLTREDSDEREPRADSASPSTREGASSRRP